MSWSSTHAPIRVSKEQENKELTESTVRVLAKNPSKVKSMIEECPWAQECESLEISRTLKKKRFDVYIVM